MNKKPDKQWTGKSRGGRFGYLFFVYAVKWLGLRVSYGILAFIVVYFIPFAPKGTVAIWDYCRKRRKLGVLKSAIELYRHYYVFGQTIIDKIAFRSGLSNRFHFEFDNYERFLEIIDGGQGVVMIGAHVGCWEAGKGFFGKYGKKINVVMFDAEHRQIKEVLDNNSEMESDFKIIAINNDPLMSMLEMKIALDNGEYVCFNGDRHLDIKGTAEVLFLNSVARFPLGPFVIASKCKAPVIFYYAVREPGRRYRFIFEEATLGERFDPNSLLNQYVASLEHLIVKYPRQWFNFYKFWNANE